MVRPRSCCASNTGVIALLCSLLLLAETVAQTQAPQCARTCHEADCDAAHIRYGKYCGVGHGGCQGEEPCDDVDACCKRHDECVEKQGLLSANNCHKRFITCINKHEGKTGFSTKCPYSLVIPTMRNGIELAMQLTNLLGGMDQGRPVQPTVRRRTQAASHEL